MMRVAVAALVFCLACGALSAQKPAIPKSYPLADVHEIMTLPADTLARPSMFSPKNGDTVLLRGIVTVQPTIDPAHEDFRRLMAVGNGYAAYLYDADTSRRDYAGIMVVQSDTNAKFTNFHKLKKGDVIEVVARITLTPRQADYSIRRMGNTIAEVIADPTLAPIAPSMRLSAMPPAPVLPVTTFNTGNNQNGMGFQFATGAPYIGRMVEFRNLTVVQDNPSFGFADEQGNMMMLADQSCYFTHRGHRIEESEFRGYALGQKIRSIRGMITMSLIGNINGQQNVHPFTIAPVEMSDVDDLDRPPVITSVIRFAGQLFPTPQQGVELRFDVARGDHDIEPTKCLVEYSTDGTSWKTTPGSNATGSFTATIPAHEAGAVVRFRVKVADVEGNENVSPMNGIYYLRVLDRAAKIADINSAPPGITGNAIQFITGMRVTLEPTITADTTDIPGRIGNFLIVFQDDTAPLSAMSAQSFDGSDPIFGARRGDKIRVTGRLRAGAGAGVTFSEIENYETLSSGNTVEPARLSTSDVGPFYGNGNAGRWGGMLVEIRDVVVKDTNSPFGPNNGELTVADYAKRDSNHAFTRVALHNSRLKYCTSDSAATLDGRTKSAVGDRFAYIRGLLTPGNSGFRVMPRDNNDFGAVTDVAEHPGNSGVSVVPNPAGASPELQFSVNTGGNVRVTIADATGAVVRELLSEELTAGGYSVSVGGGLAAGAYFAIIETHAGRQAVPFAIIC